MDEIWEPWTPVVGQKVRVRVSAECIRIGSHQPAEKYLDHRPVGEVHRILDDGDSYEGHHARAGHPYWVTHEFVPVPNKPFHGIYAGYFSAAELEPDGEVDMPERCPSCGIPTRGAGVGENMDGTTFVYCSCGCILSGEDRDSIQSEEKTLE